MGLDTIVVAAEKNEVPDRKGEINAMRSSYHKRK